MNHTHHAPDLHALFVRGGGFLKKNVVMVIAFLAAAVTAIFVPIDKEYLGYFDLKTLSCLFCVLAVV